ncbi:hypothetical protein BL253_31770 [Pseudofrankia asymbiotica]|uniref:Uncharacterized protein n=1 Tax=Pseudofrankia asymbiotica TaxID=1834516 RepID=A0A1V2I3Z8_9ACTN|nr:hypothetical protein BL253_31770 [Pseudofrankia asymbiotica]
MPSRSAMPRFGKLVESNASTSCSRVVRWGTSASGEGRRRHGQVDGESEDNVLVAAKPADQRPGVVRQWAALALVVGVAAGERTEVVVTDLG